MRIFAGMKHTLENYIRQDNEFRQILLKLDGGVMKYWAEHPDRDFDADLFEDYEQQIIEEYLQANKQNRTIRLLPTDKLKDKSLECYHQFRGTELKLIVALKPELNAIDEELFEHILNKIEIYMEDAYNVSRRRKYPDGIPPQDFYNEVIEKYGIGGLSLDCLERVLQEYRGQAVHISMHHFFQTNLFHTGEPEYEDLYNLQTEFDIKMFFKNFFDDGGYIKLRQAVKEIIDNSTRNLTIEESRETCCKLVKDDMIKVNQFTRWVNNESYPMEESKSGEFVPLITSEERHWLHNIMYENSPGATGQQKLTPMGMSFCRFLHLLENIGKIWAAQLLRRGIDMRELEKETGTVLSKSPDFLYYVDRHMDDKRGDCCVYDFSEAKKLLAKIKKKHHCKVFTWEMEKKCFKDAVLSVMRKKKDGDFLFEKPTQWMAIYRFAVDKGIMYDMDDTNEPKDKSTPQYAVFEKFAQELQFDVTPPTRIPFTKNAIDSINKKNYVRYNTHHPWPKEGMTDPRSLALYSELDDVYKLLEKEHDKFVYLVERSL